MTVCCFTQKNKCRPLILLTRRTVRLRGKKPVRGRNERPKPDRRLARSFRRSWEGEGSGDKRSGRRWHEAIAHSPFKTLPRACRPCDGPAVQRPMPSSTDFPWHLATKPPTNTQYTRRDESTHAPVCSLPPAAPISSVRRRSLAVWMSSSPSLISNLPAAHSSLTSCRPLVISSRSASVMMPGVYAWEMKKGSVTVQWHHLTPKGGLGRLTGLADGPGVGLAPLDVHGVHPATR